MDCGLENEDIALTLLNCINSIVLSTVSCFTAGFSFNPCLHFTFLPLQVAHDVDGSGNYLLLTHRHVAHLHPFSSYLCRQPCPNPPNWVLYHEFTISRDNCIRIASEVHPQM